MKKNMGGVDRIIRLFLAAIILALSVYEVITGTLEIILLILAGIFVVTSFVSFCPLYLPFGIRTCKTKNK